MAATPVKELSGSELREHGRGPLSERREDCRAELGRRRDNLRGAVIPAWEKRKRGERLDEWDLLA